MHLSDLMNLDALHAQLTARHIARILSPDGRHWLYNYTDKATYAQAWTPETRQCRGLVTDRDGNVLAVPFPKFANVDEPGFPECAFDVIVARGANYEVTAKLDGSLIIMWYDDELGQWRCTTRGNFQSTQALEAHAWLSARQTWTAWPTPTPEARYTFLGEWIAPHNRVVVRYPTAELSLIGVQRIGGTTVSDLDDAELHRWAQHLDLPRTPRVHATLTDLRAQQQTVVGNEGWVLRWPDGFRVKVKTADYLRLAKALSGFGPAQVYDTLIADLAQPGVWAAYRQGLPEELAPDADRYAQGMREAVATRLQRMREQFTAFAPLLDLGRRAFALAVQEQPVADRPVLFALADAKPVVPILWKQLDPHAVSG